MCKDNDIMMLHLNKVGANRMRFYLVILTLIFVMIPQSAQSDGNDGPQDEWVFFDMGDVLVDTEQPKRLHYVKGAEAFLNSLRSHGYKIGLLINIPQHFGKTCDEKFKKLKHVLETTWTDKSSLKWGLFDRIFLPPNNEYRKPHPLLFLQAMSISCPASIVFFGEDLSEVKQILPQAQDIEEAIWELFDE